MQVKETSEGVGKEHRVYFYALLEHTLWDRIKLCGFLLNNFILLLVTMFYDVGRYVICFITQGAEGPGIESPWRMTIYLCIYMFCKNFFNK